MKFFKFFKKKPKELVDLIISKISSDGGDFPRIIEITLFFFISTPKTQPLVTPLTMWHWQIEVFTLTRLTSLTVTCHIRQSPTRQRREAALCSLSTRMNKKTTTTAIIYCSLLSSLLPPLSSSSLLLLLLCWRRGKVSVWKTYLSLFFTLLMG